MSRFLKTEPLKSDLSNLTTQAVTVIQELSSGSLLDGQNKLKSIHVPDLAISTVSVVADIPARDALVVQSGDAAKVLSNNKVYLYDGAVWVEIEAASTLSGLGDTTINNPINNNVLEYIGGVWINSTALSDHTANANLHFTEASIDHVNIQNKGTNTHAQIDSHISDTTIHFNTTVGLTDMDTSAPANKDFLIYSTTSNKYETRQAALRDLSSMNLVSVGNGQILKYSSGNSKWNNVDDTLADKNDVNFTALTTDDIARFNNTSGKWENVQYTLSNLVDTSIIGPTDLQLLTYLSGSWQNRSITIGDIFDVTNAGPSQDNIFRFNSGTNKYENVDGKLNNNPQLNLTSITNNDILKWDNATLKWINTPIPVNTDTNNIVDLLDTNIIAPSNGQVLTYNSGQWENQNLPAAGEANTYSSLGGTSIIGTKTGVNLPFKGLTSGLGITLTPNVNDVQIATDLDINELGNVTITAPINDHILKYSGGTWINGTITTGETNTASNVGTGEGLIFKQKSGVDLQFKKIKQGSNITVTNGTDDITIDATGGNPFNQSLNTTDSPTFVQTTVPTYMIKDLGGGNEAKIYLDGFNVLHHKMINGSAYRIENQTNGIVMEMDSTGRGNYLQGLICSGGGSLKGNEAKVFRCYGASKFSNGDIENFGGQFSTSGTAWTLISSKRIKRNIVPREKTDVFKKLASVQVVNYKHRYCDSMKVGVIAEDIIAGKYYECCIKNMPEFKFTDCMNDREYTELNVPTLDPEILTWDMLIGIQELIREVTQIKLNNTSTTTTTSTEAPASTECTNCEELQMQIDGLKGEVQGLTTRISLLEKILLE